MLALINTSYVAGFFLGFIALVLAISYLTDSARAIYDLSKAFSSLSASDKSIMPITENVIELEPVIKEEVIHLPDLFKEARVVRNHRQPDSRGKRILEPAIENGEELKAI